MHNGLKKLQRKSCVHIICVNHGAGKLKNCITLPVMVTDKK